MKNRAFTLIELLVVVLIIGILSAIALPQYQAAVLRARYQQMVVLADAIWKAQQLYYLENNSYSTDLSALSIQPAGGATSISQSDKGFIVYYPWGDCHPSGNYVQCAIYNYNLHYERSYSGNSRWCLAGANDKAANHVCRGETGKATGSLNEEYQTVYYTY